MREDITAEAQRRRENNWILGSTETGLGMVWSGSGRRDAEGELPGGNAFLCVSAPLRFKA